MHANPLLTYFKRQDNPSSSLFILTTFSLTVIEGVNKTLNKKHIAISFYVLFVCILILDSTLYHLRVGVFSQSQRQSQL